ncbi:F-actin-monooxygenase Mical isoform X3 [Contarinia nasturtii]|uniref:F-actin-monooxygenase Mical isoform X3 n=1 Tax=Contarinia nasturtii TaxID=265458 RepID=UPI0012D39B84|nr:F-actin-monooxygenase Mical isoform X3 [Contarinia nasturtii]
MSRNQSQIPSKMEHESAALAAELFDHFSSATTMRQILGLYHSMCDTVSLRPAPINEFYPKLKSKIRSWKAQALWKKFDARLSHKVYNKGLACNGTRVLVIGAGPCGLRTAIEAQLLGAKVVLIEKRDRFSRNNVLHLWPFLITDLRNLGAKKFYGKFCAGSIDHISIRQLQCILLKVALLLGVEVHDGISFLKILEPKDGCGWRADISPADHAVSHYEFNVMVGADGKRNTLEGFRRKEFRGRLAIAITANFINKKTWAEAKVEEISGVAFIFNQAFFKELYETTGIDLENIVYYKDETHYFVMTAKKHSLIDKGVIIQDFSDPAELLAPANVNTEALLAYAKEAAEFSTKHQMPNLEFAVNHYGKPDVAMFDFTSMFAAETSCCAVVKKNYRLLQCLVGDSLLEPFWPTGSGCARGFLSSMDAAYAMKLWSNQRNSILAVLAQRESIYRLLAQTTPENLHRDIGSYTVEPASRYPNLNKTAVGPHQVKHLLETDDPTLLEQTFVDSNALTAVPETLVRRKRRTGDVAPISAVLLRWIKSQLSSYEFLTNLENAAECFTNGQVFCCLINRYRPDLIDLTKLKGLNVEQCNEIAFSVIESEMGIPKALTAAESVTLQDVDPKVWLNYLEQVCEVFRGEIPHVKHPKLDLEKLRETKREIAAPDFSNLLKLKSQSKDANERPSDEPDRERPRRSRRFDNSALSTPRATPDAPSRRSRKRRSYDKFGNIEERAKRLQEIEANRNERQSKRRMQRAQQTQNFYKSLQLLQAGKMLRDENDDDENNAFEDYSIYMYRQQAPEFSSRVKDLEKKLLHPDRERGIYSSLPKGTPDEQFNDRIKSMEQRIAGRNQVTTDKKPKDLLRAIGKIESNDWNLRQIEKKIEESKKTEVGKSREKVPKWSKEQFLQRQNKLTRQDDQEVDERFKDIDQTIKHVEKQLKDGALRDVGERGKNKVASIAGNFIKKDEANTNSEEKLQKSSSKAALVFNTQKTTDICHFCKQKVYVMEKLATEGLVLHRNCLKCHHCHTSLRVGGYAFDRDDPEGKFYCTQHYRLPAKQMRAAIRKYPRPEAKEMTSSKNSSPYKTPEKPASRAESLKQIDLLDRGQTPERIEFENIDAMSDGEPSIGNIIDENEWTDRNFGTASEDSESDISSTDESSDSDSDIYEDVNGSPIEAQTLQLANEWIGKQRYTSNQYSDDDEFYASSEDDEADSQTEGEELEKARAIRMQEAKVKPVQYLPTDTETEVQSDSDSSSAVELNSATEISTDSEFERDPVTPQYSEDNKKAINRIQVKQGMIDTSVRRAAVRNASHAQKPKHNVHVFEPLVRVDPTVIPNREPLQNPRVGDYLLKQTASTEGIASKKSLELKKRYLLGDTGSSGIMKSDSMSMLDSKFKNFRSTISDCQKLLNAAVPDNSAVTKVSNKNLINSDNVVEPTSATPLTTNPATVIPNKTKLNDEKENVYDQIVSTRNEINKTETVKPAKSVTGDSEEKTTNILAENNIRDATTKVIESNGSDVSGKRVNAVENSKSDNKRNSFEYSDKFKHSEVIVSGNDNVHSLDKEISGDYKPVYDNRKEGDSNYFSSSLSAEKPKSLTTVSKRSQEMESIDPILNMPCIVWAQSKRPDSDTFSSSTSSPAEIPHFILDSTSPDTQATPSESSSNKIDDLMQMDSLMLIDGKYIGDPEDLKLMKMPESFATTTTTTTASLPPMSTATNKTVIHVQGAENVIDVKPEPKQESMKIEPKIEPKTEQTKAYKYEPIYKRPGFRFDSKNENKIDTLKNIPLILSDENEKPAKPNQLPITSPKTATVPESPDDNDKTPTASDPGNLLDKSNHSDSETEMTSHLVLTETELSDWTADDAVSENFVDMEFAMNSNKGTIKRNKKARKRDSHSSSKDKQTGQAPIAKNLDFDELEFMDTGSEDSYMETYAATNNAMLSNRGYVQFINTQPDNSATNYYNYNKNILQNKPTRIELGRSNSMNRSNEFHRDNYYIEQGALLHSNDNDLKTPMNESPATISPKLHGDSHEIEDDSLVMIASQCGNTTTEESDALTVVTSPMESAPRFDESSSSVKINSNLSNASPNKKSSSTIESPKHQTTHESSSSSNRKNSDDITYEEYVRQLQMKITQISNARDSIDIRKTKRKHVKNDSINDSVSSHHHHYHQQPQQQQQPHQHQHQPSPSSVIDNNSKSLSIYVGRPNNEPTNVVEKLEEISKERIKQKDLIHDLVMDKLQSKKLSNAEKRLNRSRNRSSALNISPNTSILPPVATPPLSHSHSHSSSSMSPKYTYQVQEPERRHCLPNKSKALSLSPTKELSIVNQLNQSTRKSGGQRPRSANVEEYTVFETPKLCKTQSFCIHTTRDSSAIPYQFADGANIFSTPVISRRKKLDEELAQTTEKLRQEARLRARLKSNQDLGLSPEEKIALLRKRYNLDNTMTTASAVPCSTYNVATPNKSDDMKVREKKMITSKSVNDISANSSLIECAPISISSHRKKATEFTSNPNLGGEQKTSPSKRRQKDPERRKSIIQAVSDFFYKKRDKDTTSSPPKEKSEGMFGRLRISPKSKSKSCFEFRNLGFGEKMELSAELSKSENCLSAKHRATDYPDSAHYELTPPPIPPLPVNYQRSDDESYLSNENRDQKKLRAHYKATRQAELKRLRIAQEIQREQEEIEVELRDLEARGVMIEKELRGEDQLPDLVDSNEVIGMKDDKLLSELMEIHSRITHLKKRDGELGIRQKELQLEYRHAQLKEQLNVRLSCGRLDKSSSDVAAEGAILNEMLDIIAKLYKLK